MTVMNGATYALNDFSTEFKNYRMLTDFINIELSKNIENKFKHVLPILRRLYHQKMKDSYE